MAKGGGGDPLKGTKFQSPEKGHHHKSIPVYVEPQGGRFCFVCQKSNPISRVHTKTGVAVIRLANKYPCPFLLATLTMKDTLLELEWNSMQNLNLVFPDPERIPPLLSLPTPPASHF